MLEDIAEGKTLSEITREHDIKYMIVWNWITGDTDRQAKYDLALQARGNMFRETVLEQVRVAATANLLDAVNDDGEIMLPGQIPDSVRPAISQYEETVSPEGRRTRKIRVSDKTRNAELLGKTQAMFTDKVDVAGKMTLEQLVMASMVEGKGPAEAAGAAGG
jgi:hypothetical protein